jgi:hypothetical protein
LPLQENKRALIYGVPATLLMSFSLWAAASSLPDQPSYDTVGAIEGEAISVQGPLSIEVAQGRTRTILRSGSDIRVHSGQARIDLIEGGEISVCGPAHFSVLKSVNLLTLALDTGVIHAHIERQPALTIYTAQIQAKPFAIGETAQDTVVGFDQTGEMCIRAESGAIRVEQQLGTQSIVVPQGGDVLITNGELETLRSGAGHCSCELQLAKALPPPSLETEVSRLATPQEIQKASKEAAKPAPPAAPVAPKSTEKDGPVYQVYMPPLAYDANAKVQRDYFDPQLIVLVRRVRVRPTLIFQGSVKDAPVIRKNTPPAAPAKPAQPLAPQTLQAQQKNPPTTNSILARIRAFFRSLFS